MDIRILGPSRNSIRGSINLTGKGYSLIDVEEIMSIRLREVAKGLPAFCAGRRNDGI